MVFWILTYTAFYLEHSQMAFIASISFFFFLHTYTMHIYISAVLFFPLCLMVFLHEQVFTRQRFLTRLQLQQQAKKVRDSFARMNSQILEYSIMIFYQRQRAMVAQYEKSFRRCSAKRECWIIKLLSVYSRQLLPHTFLVVYY
jgi:hypothetical protein